MIELKNITNLFLTDKLTDKAIAIIQSHTEIKPILKDLFLKESNISYSATLTRAILLYHKHHKLDYKFLMGIHNSYENKPREIYEHTIILIASILEDSGFNFSNFTQIHLFKDLMPAICFKTNSERGFRSKFSNKVKVTNDLSVFAAKDRIKFIQEAIQYIKNEDHCKLDEAFSRLSVLVSNCSTRIVKNKFREYFDVILNYDGYDELKVDILCNLIDRDIYSLIEDVVCRIYSESTCLRFKICLVNSLISIVKKGEEEIKGILKNGNDIDTFQRVSTAFEEHRRKSRVICEKVRAYKKTNVNHLVLQNINCLLEICNFY